MKKRTHKELDIDVTSCIPYAIPLQTLNNGILLFIVTESQLLKVKESLFCQNDPDILTNTRVNVSTNVLSTKTKDMDTFLKSQAKSNVVYNTVPLEESFHISNIYSDHENLSDSLSRIVNQLDIDTSMNSNNDFEDLFIKDDFQKHTIEGKSYLMDGISINNPYFNKNIRLLNIDKQYSPGNSNKAFSLNKNFNKIQDAREKENNLGFSNIYNTNPNLINAEYKKEGLRIFDSDDDNEWEEFINSEKGETKKNIYTRQLPSLFLKPKNNSIYEVESVFEVQYKNKNLTNHSSSQERIRINSSQTELHQNKNQENYFNDNSINKTFMGHVNFGQTTNVIIDKSSSWKNSLENGNFEIQNNDMEIVELAFLFFNDINSINIIVEMFLPFRPFNKHIKLFQITKNLKFREFKSIRNVEGSTDLNEKGKYGNHFGNSTANLDEQESNKEKILKVGYIYLGKNVPYDKAVIIQEDLVKLQLESKKRNAEVNSSKNIEVVDLVLLLEHEPVYTNGRRNKGSVNENEVERLKRLGAKYYESQRGGEITYHGPGQLVVYPIINLKKHNLGVKEYVNKMEQTVIETCKQLGVQTFSMCGFPGVWADKVKKIAATGCHVQRFVTSHGIALNCTTDLEMFHKIVPCGLEGKIATSLAKELKTLENESLNQEKSFQNFNNHQNTNQNKQTELDTELVAKNYIDKFGKIFKIEPVQLELLSPKIRNHILEILK
ncbi:hypothetical protein BB558_003918 [Smittium angustum]|uniref:lipoyl(octanoyl) transferase n=1 Tax=Smittium angustum TaxID=133377 RepID=A0A2U1J4S9_SMIAN|nr:hypothetical protein BB558_003918 [Smittium angustum]